MILPEIFLQLREKAIEKLDEVTKHDSFGYHIDIQDAWESIFNTTELLSLLCIHTTHASKYSELSFHMQNNLKELSKQITNHYNTLNYTSNVINTTNNLESINGTNPNFKYDLLEMGVDWLFLKKYANNLKTVLDFGAGCGRQVIGCHSNLPKFKNYIGIDASLNGYIVQNQLYNTFSILNNYKFYDLLDYQSSDIAVDKKFFWSRENYNSFPRLDRL